MFTASLIVWVGTRAVYATNPYGPPLAVLSYLGLLTGIVLAHPIETKFIAFDPRSSGMPVRLCRFVLIVVLVGGTLEFLDRAFELLGSDDSLLGNLLRYVRYAAAGSAGILVAPYLFVRFGLAETAPDAHRG